MQTSVIERNENAGGLVAGRRTSRRELPTDPAGAVRALRSCRDAMITVCSQVKPMGPVYHGAQMVIASVDAMATLLTGHRHYFFADGSTMSEGRRQAVQEQAEKERGEKPWEHGE